jgi:hypothetical protein
MADPVSLGAIGAAGSSIFSGMGGMSGISAGLGLGSSVLGGIMGSSSAKASAESQKKMGMYQAGVAMLNAKIAQQNADYASVEGEQSTMRYGMGARQQAGQIVAAQSASGLDVRSGSNKDVQDSQHLVSNMDMDQIRRNAAKTAYDYKVEAGKYTADALAAFSGAQDATKAGKINAATSLIGGASSVASKWLQGSQLGLFNFGT